MPKQFRRTERNQFIAFYVSEEEKRAVVESAIRNDMSISDYCRKTLIGSVSKDVREDSKRAEEA